MKRMKLNPEIHEKSQKVSLILQAIENIDIESSSLDPWYKALFKLFHIFGPIGILELALLYRYKGHSYFESTKININCNGSFFKGKLKLSWLVDPNFIYLGRNFHLKGIDGNVGERKETNSNITILPSSFSFICPDIVAFFSKKMLIPKKYKNFPLPSYLEFSHTRFIPFESEVVRDAIQKMFSKRFKRFFNKNSRNDRQRRKENEYLGSDKNGERNERELFRKRNSSRFENVTNVYNRYNGERKRITNRNVLKVKDENCIFNKEFSSPSSSINENEKCINERKENKKLFIIEKENFEFVDNNDNNRYNSNSNINNNDNDNEKNEETNIKKILKQLCHKEIIEELENDALNYIKGKFKKRFGEFSHNNNTNNNNNKEKEENLFRCLRDEKTRLILDDELDLPFQSCFGERIDSSNSNNNFALDKGKKYDGHYKRISKSVFKLYELWGPEILLQVLAHHAVTRIIFEDQSKSLGFVYESSSINYKDNNNNNKKEGNRKKRFTEIQKFRKMVSLKELDQALSSLIEPVVIFLKNIHYKKETFSTLQLPPYLQLPFINSIPFTNNHIRKEVEIFLLKMRLEGIEPTNLFDLNFGEERGKSEWIKVCGKSLGEIEEDAFHQYCYRTSNPIYYCDSNLYVYNEMCEKAEKEYKEEQESRRREGINAVLSYLAETVGFYAILELGCIKLVHGSRRLKYDKLSIRVDSPLLGKKTYSLLDLVKLEVIHVERRSFSRKSENEFVTSGRILSIIPDLCAFVLKRFVEGVKNEEGNEKVNEKYKSEGQRSKEILPYYLDFPHATKISFTNEFTKGLIQERNILKGSSVRGFWKTDFLKRDKVIVNELEKGLIEHYEKSRNRSFEKDRELNYMVEMFEENNIVSSDEDYFSLE